MCQKKRHPLEKTPFLQSTRQIWMGIFLVSMFVLLLVDKSQSVKDRPLDVRAYLDFLSWIGISGLGALTLSSYNKERDAMRENESIRGLAEREEHHETPPVSK